jgi:hypothetical protein
MIVVEKRIALGFLSGERRSKAKFRAGAVGFPPHLG